MTITIASSRRSSPISSSITAVERGSSAEHGSSISSTSGRVAIARAMHRRCCWPPDRRSAGRSRSSRDLVVEAGAAAARRPPAAASYGLAAGACDRLLAQRVGDVVEDRHRERVGLLEDHRHAAAQLGDLERVDVARRRAAIAPVAARARGQLGEAVERAQQRRLAAARGPDEREHLALADRQRDVLDRRLGRRRRRCSAVERHALGPGAPRAARAPRRGRPTRRRARPSAASRRRSAAPAAAAGRRRAPVGHRDSRLLGLIDHAPSLVDSSPVCAPRWRSASTAKFRPMTISSSTNAAA